MIPHPSPDRRTLDLHQKKQAHRHPEAPTDVGDAWIWRALALPSRLRVVSHLSLDRSDPEARAFLAKFKARTDGRAPFFASDQLPAYVAALIACYSTQSVHPKREIIIALILLKH
jgi:transposase-like protein